MPKIKIPKSNPSLDMTPMVDLAFLLVTFFMLTASSRVSEPVQVDTPFSTSEKLLPENAIMITIDAKGKAYYNINNYDVRIKTLEKMGEQYKTTFTDKEKKPQQKQPLKRIVIDAGHGGHDGGAPGKYSNEKDIALSIALKSSLA